MYQRKKARKQAPKKDDNYLLLSNTKTIMDEVTELYTLREGKATLREYVIPATNKHRFEVKSLGRVLYDGESYQEARALYRQLSES